MAEDATFRRLADRLLTGAKGYGDNDFKIVLAKRAIARALTEAATRPSQSQGNGPRQTR
ncbi:hypothetical protein D3C71_2249020 [compost metagenome]